MVVNAFEQSLSVLLAKFGITAPDVRIQGLTLDSRRVTPKLAFVAVKGHSMDGREFIPQAISLGAKAILAQTEKVREHGRMEMRGTTIIVHLYELTDILSSLAGAFYDYPATKMQSVAVTGTNGKTSVVQMLSQLTTAGGTRCAAVGTLGAGLFQGADTEWEPTPAGNTTPDAIRMQYLLAEFVQQNARQVAFEASSHALVQGRLSQIKTDIVVFTNLSRDHLDYHGTMEDYGAAKRLAMQLPGVSTVVLNADDPESDRWHTNTPSGVTTVWYGMSELAAQKSEDRHCLATNVKYHPDGCQFRLVSSWGSRDIQVPLLGAFNVHNLLAVISVMLVQGLRFEEVVALLPKVSPVAGRMEVFPFTAHANVIVDYAHTPDALEKALQSTRAHTPGDVWCVFGCGGDRDKGKRPLMGQAAEAVADHLVITTDNSRSEAPEDIARDIREGLTQPQRAVDEPDREKAIRHCLEKAAPEDLILVAGKGHEDYQIIGEQKKNYNERAVVARLQREYS
ncbi:UDP-N-acetylmuramoyl-L-alanyl-D-glutamate--2,6-diaminopimelate ligase [Alteromonas sp. 1_MG-2023]|uniref:UDP-N-acetylmuramoyl-L-alanyl-D-glutamate--2, 6-diaminopimelate ligase n=1 Tax=Alteromonas sp. 1_MG-2023 TaxID=3062669 RepID=UPI0026E315A1|nr:UDP-N-acetylmuramoyl-L-alanyl-D-glutamate--2,6-diaminopimelate ligase [Alteromonas sp. 1_MG-2023]MDO6474755.1 UDP-N-acetylmuramoyl-L-alanyl-D-glutamate--2,6-diaminopimelate ligase [Alteromonas sp. 1_MG-2023]